LFLVFDKLVFINDSEKSNTERKPQLLALGVLCKLLQKIESTDTVKCLQEFFLALNDKIKYFCH